MVRLGLWYLPVHDNYCIFIYLFYLVLYIFPLFICLPHILNVAPRMVFKSFYIFGFLFIHFLLSFISFFLFVLEYSSSLYILFSFHLFPLLVHLVHPLHLGVKFFFIFSFLSFHFLFSFLFFILFFLGFHFFFSFTSFFPLPSSYSSGGINSTSPPGPLYPLPSPYDGCLGLVVYLRWP